MKKDVNSMNIAPLPIKPACLRIMGMAILPTADAPVKNLAASIQLQENNNSSVKEAWYRKWKCINSTSFATPYHSTVQSLTSTVVPRTGMKYYHLNVSTKLKTNNAEEMLTRFKMLTLTNNKPN